MVGVKGKYKGCNTCRKRRVACDNTRPFCKKCTDHDRHCEGYQTETVFIVASLEDKGRCASHPPRNHQGSSSSSSSAGKKKAADTETSSLSPEPVKSRRRAASEGQQKDTQLEFTEVNPIGSSWNECINVASVGGLHRLKFAAIHTNLKSIRRHHENLGDWEIKLNLPASKRVNVVPTYTEDEFKLEAECFLSLSRSSWRPGQGQTEEEGKDEGICLLLYEQTSSASYISRPPWKDPAILDNPVRRMGPGAFKVFPAHHFFTRVYRPNALFAALLNHNSTHLSDPEWITAPWEHSPKTSLDSLLDIIAQLPSLVSRSDRIWPLPASVGRCLKAKDLLVNCAAVESQFEAWYAGIEEAAARNRECPLLYWPWHRKSGTGDTGQWEQGQVPFQVTYDFPTAEGGLGHIYYWTGLIVLYGIMARLVEVVTKESSGVGPSAPALPLPTTPNSITSAATYLQPQPQGYVYSSPAASIQSYGSVSTEDLSTPPSTAPLHYYPTSSSSPYTSSTSSHVAPSPLGTHDLPLGMDPAKYRPREIRKLAANICRSLDWAIGRSESDALGPLGQPDLIAAQLYIVETFYESIGRVGDGELEKLWCVGFRDRWERRGREIESRILNLEGSPRLGAGTGGDRGTRSWIELGKFGV